MTVQGQLKDKVKILEIAVAVIAIISFIFGVANWGDIQQYFWRQRIVGTWQDEGGNLIRFDGDGNYTMGGLLPANGLYDFPDKDHIILQTSGIFGIVGNQMFEVKFSGKTMGWQDLSLGFTYTYSKVK
ncbi:MAG: hypothetical protein JW987_00595 [Anaerolineaceae bacterium]|nr:hypothetical protein [Anaerolineaceae bacterium]